MCHCDTDRDPAPYSLPNSHGTAVIAHCTIQPDSCCLPTTTSCVAKMPRQLKIVPITHSACVSCCCLCAGSTNDRSDRIAQALSASSDAIGLAVSGRSDATRAAQQSRVFATLAGRDSTRPEDFGRKLQQGKKTASICHTSRSLNQAVLMPVCDCMHLLVPQLGYPECCETPAPAGCTHTMPTMPRQLTIHATSPLCVGVLLVFMCMCRFLQRAF